MPSLNRIMIIGNLGSEPEMRFTPNGKPVTSFRVATNRVYTAPEGEKRQETDWFTVVTWGKLAEQCKRDGFPCLIIPSTQSPRTRIRT